MLNKCPCCKKSFTKWNYCFRIGTSSCKTQKDYGYLHCISCGNQISKPMKGKYYKYIFVGILGFSWILARYTGNSISFLDGVNKFFVDIPIIAIILLFVYIGVFYIFTFYCYESNKQFKAKETPEESSFLVKHVVDESAKSFMKYVIAMMISLIIIFIFSVFWLK